MMASGSYLVVENFGKHCNRENVVLLADEKSKNMKVFCPLCYGVYENPHIASCGHTFCQDCVPTDVKINCPQDGVSLSLLVKNIAVAEEVGELKVHCYYGCRLKYHSSNEYVLDPQGCPTIIKLSERSDHEEQCPYSPIQCPNSPLCGEMLRKDLEVHLMSCENIPCPHRKYKCTFQGTREEVEEHIKTCEYEGVKGLLAEMGEQIRDIQDQLVSKNALIEDLSSSVTELRETLTNLETSANGSSLRIVTLEEQQSSMQKDLIQAKNSMGKIVNDVKHHYIQYGMGDDVEHHHYKCQGTFVGHKGPLWDLCKNGDLLFSGSSDNSIKVWNLSNMYRGPTTLTGHDGIVLALCTHGDFLFSGSSDKTIKVWNIKTSELHHTITDQDDPVCTLTCTDTYLFSGSLKTIKVWDLYTHQLVKQLPSQNHWVRALVSHGKYLYSGSYQAVKIWSLETLEVVHVLKCVGASVYSLAVTSKHIICGTYENIIHVWDVHSLQEIGTLSGHVGIVYSLTVLKTQGKMRLFSASYDKTIRVWNLELMNCGQILARHEGSVTCVLASTGRVFSGAVDNTLKVWQ